MLNGQDRCRKPRLYPHVNCSLAWQHNSGEKGYDGMTPRVPTMMECAWRHDRKGPKSSKLLPSPEALAGLPSASFWAPTGIVEAEPAFSPHEEPDDTRCKFG